MKLATTAGLVVLLAGAGCRDDEHFPPGEGGPPGNGSGGSDRPDAGLVADGSTAADADVDLDGGLSGRLCDIEDLRLGLSCGGGAPSGIDIAVLPGSDAVFTDATGRFALDVPSEEDLVLLVGNDDPDTRLSIVPAELWDGTGVRAPWVSSATWSAFLSAIDETEADQTGTVAVYVVRADDAAVGGATVEVAGGEPAYYDLGAENEWIVGGATSASGAAIVFDVPAPGQVDVIVSVDGGSRMASIPVEPGALTWARVVIADL